MRQMVPDSKKIDVPGWLQEQPNGSVTWCTNDSVYTETQKEFFSWCWTQLPTKCRPKGQDWQILRRVSPKQSHQSSTVRGLVRTYLAVIKDRIASFDVTTHSPLLPWTIRHLRGFSQDATCAQMRRCVDRNTEKGILPLVNKLSRAAQEPMSNSFFSHGLRTFG